MASDNSSIKRRDMLKSTAGLGVAPFASDPKNALKDRKQKGKTHFVEYAVIFEGVPEVAHQYNCGIIQYHVDEENDALVFTDEARESLKKTLRDNSFVYRGLDGLHNGNKVRFGDRLDWIPVKTGHRLTVAERVALAEPISLPNVVINSDRNGPVFVNVEGDQMEVPSGKVGTLDLETIEATIQTSTEEVSEITDPETGRTHTVPEIREQTIEVTPVLHVANNGELTLFD